ncbi:hypothetical protein B566_EDAN002029 [Ephemera danica]|nr:hypothetical protein B566_EDAN002029 [Ephemera danica]
MEHESSRVKEEVMDQTSEPRSADYGKLIDYGLDEKVASKLDEIYKTGKLAHADLDERALDALKEFPVDGALNVLTQFLDSNLEHVSNKSAFLCGVMKTYRQKSRAGQAAQIPTAAKAPDEDKIKSILDRTGYTLDVTTGQRKYGGPPPDWEGSTPGNGCEVFCGKIPRDMYEDELIPLFEKCGKIWDLRLMMDPMTGQNRGYAFITFTNRDAAQQAVRELDNYEIKPGKTLKVNISVPNLRLFVGNIPKSRGKEEILEEFSKLTGKVIYVWKRKTGLFMGDKGRTLFTVVCAREREGASRLRSVRVAIGASRGALTKYTNVSLVSPSCQVLATKTKERVDMMMMHFSCFLNINRNPCPSLNDYEIRKGKKIGVTISYNNHRLFVGNIPKNRDRDELFEEFAKHAPVAALPPIPSRRNEDDSRHLAGFPCVEVCVSVLTRGEKGWVMTSF